MKKISFRVRNFDKEQFLTFNIDNEAELDEELLDFLEDEEPAGIVPVIFEEGEEFDTFSYNITDKIRLSELSDQEINAEMVLMVLRGLVLALIDMAEYRIPLSYLVLNRNYIYIDSEYKVEFVCIPLEEMQEEVELNHFLRNFLASLRFEASENGDYVAKLFTYINNQAVFNLRNMVTLVEDLMEDKGIEIPADDSSEIYAEYHEVKEEGLTGDTTVLTEDMNGDEEKDVLQDIDAAEALEDAEEIEDALEDLKNAAEAKDEDAKPDDNEINEQEESAEKKDVEETGELEEDETDSSEEDIDAEPEKVVKEDAEEADEPEEDVKEDAEEADEPEEDVKEDAEEADEPEEDVKEDAEEADEPEEDVKEDAEDADDEASDESQEIVNKIKEKISKNNKKSKNDNETEETEKDSKDKGAKKPAFKTKEASVGVVIQDDLDEYLAEKEMEEKMAHHEESSLKIKKNIKVSRASILKSTQEELKAAEETAADVEEETDAAGQEEEVVSNSILSQTINGATNILKGAPVPKVNPYLIRVNTDERIMITKQNFKIGKASMGVDYTVKGNGAVSRVHAVITNKDGIYYIKDNKSTNHTFVNGKTVQDGESELLTHDSKIVLGDEEFVFKLR